MAEWETIAAWQNVGGQRMTARWLNRLIHNLDWANGYATWGSTPFRSVKWAVNSAVVWANCWQGYYRHTNDTLSFTYSLWRTSQSDFDNSWGTPLNPLADAGQNTQCKLQMYYAAAWHDLIAASQGAEGSWTGTAAINGLGLTANAFYPLRVIGLNGGVSTQRIHGSGSASYVYPTLPTVTDGTVLAYTDFNLYRTAQLYLKQVLDSPRGAFWGVYDRRGRDDGAADMPLVLWTGRVRHRGRYLKYRFGTRWPHDATAYLTYNGQTINTLTEPGDGIGATYTWLSGTYDLNTLPGGATVGTFYDVLFYARTDPGHADTGYGAIDYCFEVDGEPASALTCARFAHGADGYVYGDTVAKTARLSNLNADFATVKTAVDYYHQVPVPDIVSDAANWPAAHGNPGDLRLIRQRTTLLWASNGDITIRWYPGGVASYNEYSLGTSAAGSIDLRSLNGLAVGDVYYLQPRANVYYAMEV